MKKWEPLRLIEDVSLLIDSMLFQKLKNDQAKISVRPLCPASLMYHQVMVRNPLLETAASLTSPAELFTHTLHTLPWYEIERDRSGHQLQLFLLT